MRVVVEIIFFYAFKSRANFIFDHSIYYEGFFHFWSFIKKKNVDIFKYI